MNLRTRLKKLQASRPKCEPGITRIIRDGEPTEADRCPRCGGCHTLFIREIIVHNRDEFDALQARIAEQAT